MVRPGFLPARGAEREPAEVRRNAIVGPEFSLEFSCVVISAVRLKNP